MSHNLITRSVLDMRVEKTRSTPGWLIEYICYDGARTDLSKIDRSESEMHTFVQQEPMNVLDSTNREW